MRRLPEHPAQPPSSRGTDQGQIGIHPGRAGRLQPRPGPPQIRGDLLGLIDPPGGEQLLDQMLPQVPGRLRQLSQRRHCVAADRVRRGGGQA
jgi:hypothetical protein